MEGFGEVGEFCGGGGGEEGGCEEVAEEGEVVGRAVAGGGIVRRRHEVNVDETSAEASKRLDWTCGKYTKDHHYNMPAFFDSSAAIGCAKSRLQRTDMK